MHGDRDAHRRAAVERLRRRGAGDFQNREHARVAVVPGGRRRLRRREIVRGRVHAPRSDDEAHRGGAPDAPVRDLGRARGGGRGGRARASVRGYWSDDDDDGGGGGDGGERGTLGKPPVEGARGRRGGASAGGRVPPSREASARTVGSAPSVRVRDDARGDYTDEDESLGGRRIGGRRRRRSGGGSRTWTTGRTTRRRARARDEHFGGANERDGGVSNRAETGKRSIK